MQRMKIALLLVGAGAILFGVLAQAEPTASPAKKHGAFDSWLSEAELARLAGAAPGRCVHAGPGRKLCGWSLSGRLLRPGGTAAEARAEVVELICELPVEPAGDGRGPCRTHARGDRTRATADVVSHGLPHVSARGPAADRERVWQQLSTARTVTELSHLVGTVPDSCRVQLRSDHQRCEWRLAADDGLLAALAPVDGIGVLRCALPLDGSERDPTSCGVVRLD